VCSGGVQGPTSDRSQPITEAEGSLTLEAQGQVGAALTTTGRASTTRWLGSGKRDGKVYESRNQWWNPLKRGTSFNLVDMGWATVHANLSDEEGDLEAGYERWREGHGKSLRHTHGEAVGEELDAAPVNRHTVNMGTIFGTPSPPPIQGGDGQARRRLTAQRWGGGSVVVRGWESQPHGEGIQRSRSKEVGMPGGRR